MWFLHMSTCVLCIYVFLLFYFWLIFCFVYFELLKVVWFLFCLIFFYYYSLDVCDIFKETGYKWEGRGEETVGEPLIKTYFFEKKIFLLHFIIKKNGKKFQNYLIFLTLLCCRWYMCVGMKTTMNVWREATL